MKHPLLFCMFLMVTSFVVAQVPQAINYQAIARTSTGAPIVNAAIGVRFKILKTSSTGTSVYSETHAPTTNQAGLFNLQIGNGGNKVGVFANIDWGSGAYFLEVAIDPAGGTNYQVVGTPSQFLSVPYALRSSCNCSMMVDADGDTWVETDPNGTDRDEIHMSLGKSPGGSPGIPGPTVLILKRNNTTGNNTMLELIDGNNAENTFIGQSAGNSNTTGTQNTAIGLGALSSNQIGGNNSAFGHYALRNNATGIKNTGMGQYPLFFNADGSFNTAVGVEALYKNLTSNNTAVGYEALRENVMGANNTSIGVSALRNNINGNANTALGYLADVGVGLNLNNSSAIGANAKVMTGNSMILGDNNVNVGIGLSGNALGPANKLEINAAAADESGLTFRRLTSNSPTTVTATKVLSVDANGKVILALANSGGGGWLLGGNTLSTGSEFLGTLNTFALNFKVNNQKAGTVTPNGPVFLGYQAGNVNTALTNTGIGYQALLSNIAGNSNTATGYQALLNNTGSGNTAIGTKAMATNTGGGNNTALGLEALKDNQTGQGNTASGVWAMHENTIGEFNTALGTFALEKNTRGFQNTATGHGALNKNVLGIRNTAIGASALASNTANDNIAIGAAALELNVTGIENTATGTFALSKNVSGRSNTAMGLFALQNNTRNDNAAFGVSVLRNNTAGGTNTAVGNEAMLANITGSENAAIGYRALASNTSGATNTASGNGALFSNVTGNCNTGLGYGADVGSGNLTNATAIGCLAIVTSSNKIQLGNSAVSSIMGPVAYTISDGRFKSAVRQDAPGLDFVLSLRPVTYNFDYTKFSSFVGEKGVDQQVLKQKDQKREMGFIAQELESICLKSGIDIVNLIHTPENEKDNYAIAYGQLVIPLVKAVQEQQVQIETLKNQNAQLETIKQQNQSLQSQLDQLRADMQFFRAALEKQTGQTNNRNR